MLSRISKMSVFGIVALMLALGLATTDVLAVKGSVLISHDQATSGVRAAAEVDIEFSIEAQSPAPTEGDSRTGTVTIVIPSVWSRPVNANSVTLDEVGEVLVGGATGTGDDELSGKVDGRSLVATIGKNVTSGTLTFTFRTIAPARSGVYQIPVSGQVHNTLPFAGADAVTSLNITVGPVSAGAGMVALSPLTAEPDTDDNLAYEKYYLLTSEQTLSNLRITFTASGTMPQNSTIVLTSASFAAFTRQDNSQVAVSGHVDAVRAAQTVTATVKEGGIQKGATVVFSIPSHYKAPKIAPDATAPGSTTAIETGWTIAVQTTVPDTTVNAISFTGETTAELVGDPAPGTPAIDAQFNFVTTKAPPVGKVVVYTGTSGTDELKYIVADAAIPGTTLRFDFADLAGIGDGAKYEIDLPSVLPDAYQPIGAVADITTVDDANKGAAAGPEGATIAPRKFSGALPDDNGDFTGVAYRLHKIPVTQGAHTVAAKGSVTPRGALVGIGGHTFEIVVGPGKGSLSVKLGGQPFLQTTSAAEVGDLEIVYTAGGYMANGSTVTIDLPAEDDDAGAADQWSGFRTDNGDGIADRGEVLIQGSANLVVTDADTITLTTTAALNNGDQLTVTYKNVKAAKDEAGGSYGFSAKSNSYPRPAADLAASLGDVPKFFVGIGRSPDGGGSLALSATEADAGALIGDLAITYTAAGKMEVGSAVEISLPTNGNWPTLGLDVSQPGGVTLADRSSTLAVTSTTMTATTQVQLSTGDEIKFIIKNLTAPSTGGTYTFTGKSKSSDEPEHALQPLSAGVTMTVLEVASGSIALNGPDGPISSAAPGMALGNLSFVFTAGAAMEVGSKVTVEILPGWTPAFLDNNDGADSPGEASLMSSPANAADFVVSGGGGTPWVLTATLTSALAVNDTLTFTYKQVTAPSTEDTYVFATKASIASGATALPVQPPPTVVVREPVTALAISAEPTSVFTGGEITVSVTLWAGTAEGKALGNMMVSLDDGDAGGTFTPASIAIADNTHSGSAMYTNASAGMVTITAMSGDLEAVTVDVEIKSTIRGLSVNGEAEMALVTQGGMLMVRAVGPEGGGTVTVLNADGEKVGTKKALDPIGDPDADGDQEYSRSVTLPDVLADGMYTISVEIQGDVNNSLSIQVVNDQSVPMLSDAAVLPSTVMNGNVITLTVKATSPSMSNPIASVSANVSAVDSTQTDPVILSMQQGADSTYVAVHTISMDNNNADGMADVIFTATNQLGGENTAMASVTLANDPSVIESVTVEPDMVFRPGDTPWIKAMATAGQTATFSVAPADGGDDIVSGMSMEEDPAGMYVGSFDVVADAHPEGMYVVTVTLNANPAKSMTAMLEIGPAGYMFTLSIPAGTHAIHVPLAVNMINGEEGTIETVGDLYDALGDAVNFIISFINGTPVSYLGDESAGSMADAAIGDDTGLIAVMKSAATLELVGDALGTGGASQISIAVGNNLVGVPLDPAVDMMISDALVAGVEAIAVSNAAGDGFHTITAAGDMGDGPLMGGVGYIVVASAAGSIPIVGTAWESEGAAAAPSVVFSGSQTPVLHVSGGLLDEFDMMSRIPQDGLSVTVKNLSTGASLDTVLGTELSETAYSGTFVEFSRHAAKAGDVLEITAHSPSPFVGVRPVPQIVVNAEEVLTSRISLPDLELYEIPSETELLANYPNPFNPETWIPYRLAKAAKVSLEIYDTNGALVRSIDVGFKPAAVYESRASAIYWDGRNNYGERVASGTYFYHLTAGEDYASTRRMVILK